MRQAPSPVHHLVHDKVRLLHPVADFSSLQETRPSSPAPRYQNSSMRDRVVGYGELRYHPHSTHFAKEVNPENLLAAREEVAQVLSQAIWLRELRTPASLVAGGRYSDPI